MKKGIDYPGVSVAFFCHDGNGNFLFHKRGKECRDHVGTWDCGGGGLEHGEQLEEALLRELKEEYCCAGEIDQQLHPNTFLHTENGETNHWIIHPYIVRVNPDEIQIGEPHKMEEFAWFKLDALPENMHPGVAHDLETYSEFLKPYAQG